MFFYEVEERGEVGAADSVGRGRTVVYADHIVIVYSSKLVDVEFVLDIFDTSGSHVVFEIHAVVSDVEVQVQLLIDEPEFLHEVFGLSERGGALSHGCRKN